MRRERAGGPAIQMREGANRCHRDLWGEWTIGSPPKGPFCLLAEAWAPLGPGTGHARVTAGKAGKAASSLPALPGPAPAQQGSRLRFRGYPMAPCPWTSTQDDMSFVTSLDFDSQRCPAHLADLSLSRSYCTYLHTLLCLIGLIDCWFTHSRLSRLDCKLHPPVVSQFSACGLPLMPCP